jgi:hypothetical protein
MTTRIHRPLKVIAFNANDMIYSTEPGITEALYILYIHLITCKIYIVHTDNRLITADRENGKRQTRPLVKERAPL